jgi:segregation and condensation protein B
MPDDEDAPVDEQLSELATTTAVAIPTYKHGPPVALTNAPGDEAYVVPDDAAPPAAELESSGSDGAATGHGEVTRAHLTGLLEALIFASDQPQKASDLAKVASVGAKEVREVLGELKAHYQTRGIQLDEVAGGWIFRTSSAYAPFVRDLTKQKPVRLSRAQVETLAILAYRQPVTRPEIDEIRGVDSGPVLKVLLERDLVRILGKKDEPGRPLIYGTTNAFLEFFGLKSLRDLPTLREFTELTEDSRRVAERELGEVLDAQQPREPELVREAAPEVNDTIPPEPGGVDATEVGMPHDTIPPAAPDSEPDQSSEAST